MVYLVFQLKSKLFSLTIELVLSGGIYAQNNLPGTMRIYFQLSLIIIFYLQAMPRFLPEHGEDSEVRDV